MKNGKKLRRRVIALLTRDQIEFLDKLGMDSLFSTGAKLPRVKIIGALVDAAMALGLSAKGIKNKKELAQRLLSTAYAQQNRRSYPRINRSLLIKFRTLDSLKEHKTWITEDISLGGFKIDIPFSYAPPPVGQVIEFILKGTEEGLEPIKAIGRIIWMREKEDKKSLEIGVKLTYIREENKAQFMSYLKGETENEATEH